MVTFNNCCDAAYLKFKLPCDKTTDYFKNCPLFRGKKCKFHQTHEFCISQGTVATFLGVVDRFKNTHVEFFQFRGQIYKISYDLS